MGGILLLMGFLLCGCVATKRLFARQKTLTQLWLGMVFGLVMAMWLPSLWAFAFKFSTLAHWCALASAAFIAGACLMLPWQRPPQGSKVEQSSDCLAMDRLLPQRGILKEDRADQPSGYLIAALVLPLLLVSAYMLYTHTLRPQDGALHVGQSTYGDLSLHLGIATGLRDAAYPPEYTILPGTLLGYPFLVDALSGSMLLFGTSLRFAFIVPSLLMMALVFLGFVMLAWELTKDKRAVVLSFLLVFLNGGLGFIYLLDRVFEDPSRLIRVFTDFYWAPANLLEYNVRWSNILVDMLIPQRTFLAGWAVTIPAFWLLVRALEQGERKDFVLLGALAGTIPMIHTHSFFALGLISAGIFVRILVKFLWSKFKDINDAVVEEKLIHFLTYGVIAVALALPQLMLWTFPQTAGGGSLKFSFNWVNGRDGRLIDEYFWFWIKNIGVVALLLWPAASESGKRGRLLSWGALFLFVIAELFLFQPNPYDNNKLFYVGFMLMMPFVAMYVFKLYDRLKGIRGRTFLLAVFVFVSTLSGAMSVGREWVSDYELFSAEEVAAAKFIEENTPMDSVFATSSQHKNPVSSLTGRKLVCGTPTFLYFHGVDYSEQQEAVRLIYEQPLWANDVIKKYSVDYIYISYSERGQFEVDEDAIESLWPLVYEGENIKIYGTSQ